MRNPLVPIVLAFAAGIGSAPYFYQSASQQVFWIGVVLPGALLLLRTGRYTLGLALALAGFFLCGTFLAAEEHSVLPPRHIELLARRGLIRPEGPLQVAGWSRTPSVQRPGGEYFDLQLTQVSQSGASIPAEGLIRIYHFASRNRPESTDVSYGTRLSFSVRNLRRPRNFMTAGFYDWEASMERQDIYFTGILREAQDLEVLPGRQGSRWRAALYRLRRSFLSGLDRLFPPGHDRLGEGAILKAMLLGDDNWLDPGTAAAFQESGTYHLLVISGLHVGALAFGLFWLFSCLRPPRWLETLMVASCVVVFTVLANARVPAVRAALMICLYLMARLVYRERALLNSIALAAFFLLVLHPSDLRDPGFQLSFLAVVIIGAVAAPIAEWTIVPYRQAVYGLEEKERDPLFEAVQSQFRQDVRVLLDYFCDPSRLSQRRWRFFRALLLKAISGALAVAEAAVAVFFMQAGLAFLMAAYFHRVVWSGMVANLLILPLTGLILPLGFLVLVASALWSPAAVAGARMLGFLVTVLHATIDWSARLPLLDWRVPAPPVWLVMVFLFVLCLIAVLVQKRLRPVWLPVAALLPLGLILTLAPYTPRLVPGRLEVTALDVGQGDSLFITFPRGHTMLIDGGGEIPIPGEPPPRFDVGERIVSPYLWSRYMKIIDFVVLTHAHWDHLGGLLSVLLNYRVGELWIGPGPSDAGLERLLELAKRRGIPVVRHQSGERKEVDGVEIMVLSPDADWRPKRVSNNDSLVLRLGYGTRHILLPGDVESRMERRLVAEELPIASEVLKVAHHGSKTSTTAPFLSRVGPRFGIISVGAYGRFGHPNQEVLDTLEGAGVKTYRTDLDGSVTVSTDGNKIEFTRFRDTIRPWPEFQILPLPLGFVLR